MANNTDWLNISQVTGGTGETVLSLTALTNNSLEPKTATITARNTQYNVSDTTTVTIQGFQPTLTLSRSTLRFDSTGGTATFTVYSNTAWTINFPAIVHSYSTSAGTGDTEVTVALAQNFDEVAKIDTGIVKDTFNVNQLYLTIVQESFIVELNVEPTDDIVFKNTGSTTAITIDSNAIWELEYPSWVTPSITSGESGTTTVTFTAGQNGPTDRNGEITVYAGSKSVTINVFQSLYIPPYITVTPSAYTFSYTASSTQFVVDSFPEWTAEIMSTGETHWGEDIAFKMVMYLSASQTISLKQTGVIANGVVQKTTNFTAPEDGSYTFLYPYTGDTMPVFYDSQSDDWNWNYTLRELEIYDSITTIPETAFYRCSYLSSVTIGTGVTNIGSYAFGSCQRLNTINITATIAPTIVKYTFSDVANNGTLSYPIGSDYSSWLNIRENYLGYYNWNNVRIESTLLVARVYYNVSSTTEPVDIFNSSSSIDGPYAFRNEESEIIIFDKHSPYYTFKHTGRNYLDFLYSPSDNTTSPAAQGLQTVAITGLTSVTDVIIYDYPRTVSGFVGEQTSTLNAGSCPNLTAITINRNTYIPNGNNSCFANVTTYSVGGSVSEVPAVGDYYNYTAATKSLQTVQIITTGDTVFPEYCFARCTALTDISITTSGNVEFGGYCFASATTLSNLSLPTNTTGIGSYCFRNTPNLNLGTLVFANRITLSDYAFAKANIETLQINGNDSSIGGYCFLNSSLRTAVLNGVSMARYSFSGSNIQNVTLSDITEIPLDCFHSCGSLVSVTLGDGLTTISSYSFQDCTALQRIEIPNSVQHLGSRCFYGCATLKSLVIGSGVADIGTEGFGRCNGLEEVISKPTTAPTGAAWQDFSPTNTGTFYYPSGGNYDGWINIFEQRGWNIETI